MGLTASSAQTKSENRALGYVPAIPSFLSGASPDGKGKPDIKSKRVLVIGSGCGGLGAAWHLNRAGAQVALYESDSRLGGHANTVNGSYLIPNYTMCALPSSLML